MTTPRKRELGAWYTPPWLAEALVSHALDLIEARDGGLRMLDPACGDGAFLAAASSSEHHRISHLEGWDVDATVLPRARRALGGERASAGCSTVVRQRDALAERPAPDPQFDLVAGNPPFLSQLRRRTSRSAERRDALRARFGIAASRYTDDAGLFVLRSIELTRPGGVVAMIVPRPLFATSDGRAVRERILEQCDLAAVWLDDGEQAFDALVSTGALLLRKHVDGAAEEPPVRRYLGRSWLPASSRPCGATLRGSRSWSSLLLFDHDRGLLPVVPTAVVLGTVATATADFREHFYAVGGAVRDADAGDLAAAHPVVTTRHIDPARNLWGEVTATIAGRRFDRPVLSPSAIATDAHLRRWAQTRLVPKVLVATQTKVLEVIVDPTGSSVPLTPLVTVMPAGPDSPSLWAIAALLSSPFASAWCVEQAAGTGLSLDALRVSAALLRDLPMPADRERLEIAGAAIRDAQFADHSGRRRDLLDRSAASVHAAFGISVAASEVLISWWWRRAPKRANAPA